MNPGFPGAGTALNALTVVLGSLVGMTVGNRLPERTRELVTDCLGLVTVLMAALSAASVTDTQLTGAVGTGAPVLIVLGSLLIGGIAGSILRLEARLEALGDGVVRWVGRRRSGAEGDLHAESDRFVQGWLTATLLFCVGPLTILGSLDDGLGRGIDKLAVKSVLDGFASIAFAASFGPGVLAAALSLVVVQGALTVVGILLGSVMPAAQIAALTATGGLILGGISLRLLRIRDVPVGDLLPALIVAPLLTTALAR